MAEFKLAFSNGAVEYTDDLDFEDAHDIRKFLQDKVGRYPGWVTIGHLTFHSQSLVHVAEHDSDLEGEDQ